MALSVKDVEIQQLKQEVSGLEEELHCSQEVSFIAFTNQICLFIHLRPFYIHSLGTRISHKKEDITFMMESIFINVWCV